MVDDHLARYALPMRQRTDQGLAELCVRLHDPLLVERQRRPLEQDPVGNADLADVVQQVAEARFGVVGEFGIYDARNRERDCRHPSA